MYIFIVLICMNESSISLWQRYAFIHISRSGWATGSVLGLVILHLPTTMPGFIDTKLLQSNQSNPEIFQTSFILTCPCSHTPPPPLMTAHVHIAPPPP